MCDALRVLLLPRMGSRQGISRERAAVARQPAVGVLPAGKEAANQFFFVIGIIVAAVAPHILLQHFGGHFFSSCVGEAPTFLDDMFFHLRTTTRRRAGKLVLRFCAVLLRRCEARSSYNFCRECGTECAASASTSTTAAALK